MDASALQHSMAYNFTTRAQDDFPAASFECGGRPEMDGVEYVARGPVVVARCDGRCPTA